MKRASRGLREEALEGRAADLLSAGHVARGARDDDTALDEPHEVVDLAGVVAAVGHRHDDRGGGGVIDAVADRVAGAAAVLVDENAEPRVGARQLLHGLDGRVVGGVDDDERLERQRHRLCDARQDGLDRPALAVRGHDDREPDLGGRGHMTVPSPRQPQMSITGGVSVIVR